MAFHLLGADLETGQLAQRGAGMAEARLAGRDAHHAPHRRRERGVLKTRAKPCAIIAAPDEISGLGVCALERFWEKVRGK